MGSSHEADQTMTDPDPWSRPEAPPARSNKPGSSKPGPNRPWSNRPWPWLIALAVLVTGLVVYLAGRYPGALADGDTRMRLTYSVLLLVLLLSSALLHRRFNLRQKLRQGAIWLAIGAALILAYSLRDEGRSLWERMAGELVPSRGTVADGAITFRASEGGHFMVEVEVEGVPIRMLVDTGASAVVLSPADAVRLGFDISALTFDTLFQTANGTVRGAPVRIRRMVLGPITLTDVRASVNGTPLSQSLLGFAFFEVSISTVSPLLSSWVILTITPLTRAPAHSRKSSRWTRTEPRMVYTSPTAAQRS